MSTSSPRRSRNDRQVEWLPCRSHSAISRQPSRFVVIASGVLCAANMLLPASNLFAAEIFSTVLVVRTTSTIAMLFANPAWSAQEKVQPPPKKSPGDKQRFLDQGPLGAAHDAPESQRGGVFEIRVDARLLKKAISNEFATQNKIDEIILGTRAVGDSVTKGQIELNFHPSTTNATFSLRIDGVCEANTQCTQQPVRFESQTTTKFVGHKVISFHPDTGFESEPATVEARSNSTYKNIRPLRPGFGERLIRRIAAQQIEDNRVRAENICAERTSLQIKKMIDRRVEEKLAEANQRWRLIRLLSGLLMRFDSQWLAFNTTEQHFAVSVGKPTADHSPVILHWTEQAGITISLPPESKVQRWAAFLAQTYELILARADHLNQQAIATLQRIATQQFADILSGHSRRLKQSVLDQPPKTDR